MHMIQDLSVRPDAVARRSTRMTVRLAAALALLAGAGTLSLHAQQPTSSAAAGGATLVASNEPVASNLFTAALAPMVDLSDLGYSSSVGSSESLAAENYIPNVAESTGDALQPPPRRRYGRPRYNDSSHNADGSNKWAFMAGAGIAIPVGNLHEYDTPSWDFQVGFGRNFSKKFATLIQFDYHHFGLQGRTIQNQQALYNYGVTPDEQISGLDGNSHVWSFTVDPTYTFLDTGTVGAYVVGGVGFYHKVTNFTLPEIAEECYYYCYTVQANQNVDIYTSNSVGVNAGVGFTYKLSKFANERFYAEARYVFIPNSQREGYTIQNVATTSYNGYNAYPANSNKTSYIPITFGLRF